MKVLVVHGDKRFVNSLQRDFEAAQFEVLYAADGEAGLVMGLEHQFDLIVLDWMLPKKEGLIVLKELRGKDKLTPILMLTDENSVKDIVVSLDSGANTCVTKPFDMRVLIAKMKALVRRSKMARGAEISYAHIRLDPVIHKVWSGSKELELTGKEYGLLHFFMQHPEQVVTRAFIAEHVWDYEFDSFTNIIDVYVNYLRKKLDKGAQVKLIHTVRGAGYVFRAE